MKGYIQYIKEVLWLLGDNGRKLPWLVFLFLLVSLIELAGIGLIGPYVALISNPEAFMQGDAYRILVDWGVSLEQDMLIITMGLILLSIFVFKTVSAILINRAIFRFCFQQGVQLCSALMHSYQNLDYVDYLQRNSSDYVYRTQRLTDLFSKGILQSFLRLVSEGLIGLAIFIMLAWSNGYALGILLLLLGTAMFAYAKIFHLNIQKYGRLTNEYCAHMVQSVNESIDGLKEIRVLGKEDYFHKAVKGSAQGYSDANLKYSIITSIPRYLLELILVTFFIMMVISVLLLEQNFSTLLPTFSMFGLASMRIIPSANQLINAVSQIRFGRDTVSLLYSDLKHQGSQTTLRTKPLSPVKPDFQSLIFKQVCFSYPNTNQLVLNNISVELHTGETIGFIGPSGSGKTTLIDVLLGLLEPQEGTMLYNGQPLTDNLVSWRSQVAYLPQQVFLIDNTLRKNVALGLEESEIDEIKVQGAIQKARLAELVEQLPQGLNTLIGERGVRLSGGQRQRVALARAFYHERDVLIMDESTSSMDDKTEKEIVEEIKQLKGEKTIIVIAHRLTTIQNCDRIYRLVKGTIVEQGDYAKVVKKRTTDV